MENINRGVYIMLILRLWWLIQQSVCTFVYFLSRSSYHKIKSVLCRFKYLLKWKLLAVVVFVTRDMVRPNHPRPRRYKLYYENDSNVPIPESTLRYRKRRRLNPISSDNENVCIFCLFVCVIVYLRSAKVCWINALSMRDNLFLLLSVKLVFLFVLNRMIITVRGGPLKVTLLMFLTKVLLWLS